VAADLGGGHRLVRFLQGPVGAQCYALSPGGAAALLRKAERWIEPVDLYLDAFWRHGLACKAILPFEAAERPRTAANRSTIGDRKQKRTGLAKLAREGTRLSEMLARLGYNLTHR
jgi:glycosyl transferase family 25